MGASTKLDNGSENTNGMLKILAENFGIHIEHIQLGKPQQNTDIERYNGTVRREWLDQNIIKTIQ